MIVPSSWTVCAMPFESVRIGFFAQSPRPCSPQQRFGAAAALAQRQAAQRAHEGDRVARVHRRIEAALLGQIADLLGGIERALVAEHAARAARRVDDPQQHAQDGGLARAIGSEQAVNAPGRDGEADTVDRAGVAEVLDQVDGFDGDVLADVLGLAKH